MAFQEEFNECECDPDCASHELSPKARKVWRGLFIALISVGIGLGLLAYFHGGWGVPKTPAKIKKDWNDPPGVLVNGAVFSPDNKYLLTGYGQGGDQYFQINRRRLILWEVQSGRQIWTAEGPEPLTPIGFLPDGRTALLKGNGNLQIWDMQNGTFMRSFASQPKAAIYPAVLSPNGKLVLIGIFATTGIEKDFDEERLQLWDVESGKMLRKFGEKVGIVGAIALSPDGKLALTQIQSVSLALWDLTTGELIRRFPQRKSSMEEGWGPPFAFSPDGKMCVFLHAEKGSVTNELVLWDLTSGKEIQRINSLNTWGELVFTPDQNNIVVVQSLDLIFLEIASGRIIWRKKVSEKGANYTFSGDGKLAFTASGLYRIGGWGTNINLRIWSLKDGDLVRVLEDPPYTGKEPGP